MTRKRFNSRVLERYEFVDYILRHLTKKHGLKATFSKVDRHLRFYSGSILERKKHIRLAIVGYGGTGRDLRKLPTPLQTEFLPLVFEHWNKVSGGDKNCPLLILGHSFDEVFLRKIRLLNAVIPDVRLIQYVNVYRFESITDRFARLDKHYYEKLANGEKIKNEVIDFQSAVVKYLEDGGEIGGYKYDVLDCEVPAGEGTVKTEMIDILALERKRRWLTAIELKYEKLTNIRIQSVIFQGLDYCNWVEDHKRGLTMLFPDKRIDARRRTRLILINGPAGFPKFHKDFAKACYLRDKYQEIELYFTNNRVPLDFAEFVKTGRGVGV